MVSGGRLGKWLTVQWFSVVVWWTFEKVTDSTMVLGVRFKKSQPGQWFLEVARPDAQTTSQNHCPGCNFFPTTSQNHGTVSHFFKRLPTDLTKPMYCQRFFQATSQNHGTVSSFVQATSQNHCPGCSFSKRTHQNPCTVTFFKFVVKEGFRKPLYCQHFL